LADYRITKIIKFCYGHRLLDYEGKSRNLHGHNAHVEIDVVSKTLDKRGMVTSFDSLKEAIESWVQKNFDHRVILSDSDPIGDALEGLGQIVNRLTVNPTSENLAKILFMVTQDMGFEVSEVRFWETPTSCGSYSGGG